jgi:hypothetical protein
MNETIIAFNRITELVHEHELKDVIGVDEIYFK